MANPIVQFRCAVVCRTFAPRSILTAASRIIALSTIAYPLLCLTVKLAVEISADFPDGASESMKRAVSENARSLGINKADWE